MHIHVFLVAAGGYIAGSGDTVEASIKINI
jgi:hypothetical protein